MLKLASRSTEILTLDRFFRESDSQMIPVSKAFKIVDKHAKPLKTENIALEDAVGRSLAENVVADSDLPPFDRSQMDGYAVIADDTVSIPARLKIVGESAAGKGWRGTLKHGEAVRIMTGAPVPKGADAVQKLEMAKEKDSYVTLSEPTKPGRYFITKASEVKRGDVVLDAGSIISVQNIAVAAAFGYAKVKVAKRPRVSTLSTGSEIVEIARKPKQDQIRNSNSLMLKALVESLGCEAKIIPSIGDDLKAIKSAIRSAAAKSDVVITTGGVSVGKYDLTKLALTELGAEIYFDRVALKPGKPTVFGKLNKAFVFGLPGNPVSAAVTFHLFVSRLIGTMLAQPHPCLKDGLAVAGASSKGTKERDTYLPAKLTTDDQARLVATPVKWLGSSDLVGFAKADALVEIPKGTSIEKGSLARVLFLF